MASGEAPVSVTAVVIWVAADRPDRSDAHSRSINALGTDPNDLTEIPRRIGLPNNYRWFSSLPLWPDDTPGPTGMVMAITPIEPGDLRSRTELLISVKYLLDAQTQSEHPATVVDVIQVDLKEGEQLSLPHIGCRVNDDLKAVVFGTLRMDAEAAQIQQPRIAWQLNDGQIQEHPTENVVCEPAGGGPPPPTLRTEG